MLTAIAGGTKLVSYGQVLGPVSYEVLLPEHRTAQLPLWLAADDRLTMANAPESIGSHKLLKALSANGPPGPDACPKAVASQAKLWALHHYKQLIAEELLFALWMVDPESFAFYYIVGEQIAIVLPPSDPTRDRVPSPASLPPGVDKTQLGMLYRRSGLQLLAVSRVAHRLAHEWEQLLASAGGSATERHKIKAKLLRDGQWCLSSQAREAVSCRGSGGSGGVDDSGGNG